VVSIIFFASSYAQMPSNKCHNILLMVLNNLNYIRRCDLMSLRNANFGAFQNTHTVAVVSSQG